MTIVFDRPVGAAADVKELEYISALHQTDPGGVRPDGSIRDVDVSMFLSSRFGIQVTREEVRDIIMKDLGQIRDSEPKKRSSSRRSGAKRLVGDSKAQSERGEEVEEDGKNRSEEDDSDDDGQFGEFDMLQLTAMLLIPTLLKAKVAETSEEVLSEEYVQPTPDLLRRVWTMIQEDVTGDVSPKELNHDLVKDILVAYGEDGLAEDSALVDEMVSAACSSVLDMRAFVRALTDDLHPYNLRGETLASTDIDDAFEEDLKDIRSKAVMEKSAEDEENREAFQGIRRVGTAESIDTIASTYRSKPLMILMWAMIMILYFSYFYHTGETETAAENGACPAFEHDNVAPWSRNFSAILCNSMFNIFKWLFNFIIFSLFGLVCVGLGSVGNGIENKNAIFPVIGFTAIFFITFVPFHFLDHARGEGYLDIIALLLGAAAMGCHVMNFLALTLGADRIEKHPWLFSFLEPSRMFREKSLKNARAMKVRSMTDKALELSHHDSGTSGSVQAHFGQALFRFARQERVTEKFGGFMWTWRRFRDRSFLTQEGVSFSGRLVASNITQWTVVLYIGIAGIALDRAITGLYGREESRNSLRTLSDNLVGSVVNQEIANDIILVVVSIFGSFLTGRLFGRLGCDSGYNYTDEFIGSACGYDSAGDFSCNATENTGVDVACALIQAIDPETAAAKVVQFSLLSSVGIRIEVAKSYIDLTFHSAIDRAFDSLYPARAYMVSVPLIIAVVFAFLTAIHLSVTFLPSVGSTVLQLRCGVIPTLHAKDFNKYRVAPEQITHLVGSLFWGTLLASISVGVLFGFLAFICLWQTTAVFVQQFIAISIGIIIIILVRFVFIKICRTSWYRAFYRKNPRAANITMLGMEWANFALSVGFVFLRMFKLLVVAGMYVGRLDTPFLAPQVGKVGQVEIDSYPTFFRMVTMFGEAHKHPYIEQLGAVYLTKLRHRGAFGTRAGSTWRLIFVYALMPWMDKYRLQHRLSRTARRLEDGDFPSPSAILSKRMSLRQSIALQGFPFGTDFRAASGVAAALAEVERNEIKRNEMERDEIECDLDHRSSKTMGC